MNNDFFNINSNNKSIILSTSQTLVMPEKNYNASQFVSEFNIQTSSQGITGLSTAFDSQNNLLTFTNGTTGNLNFNINENQKFLGLSVMEHIY